MANNLMVDMGNNLMADMGKNLTVDNLTSIQPRHMNKVTKPGQRKVQLMNRKATPILLHLHPMVDLRMENQWDIHSLHIDSMVTNKAHHIPKVKLAPSKVCRFIL